MTVVADVLFSVSLVLFYFRFYCLFLISYVWDCYIPLYLHLQFQVNVCANEAFKFKCYICSSNKEPNQTIYICILIFI